MRPRIDSKDTFNDLTVSNSDSPGTPTDTRRLFMKSFDYRRVQVFWILLKISGLRLGRSYISKIYTGFSSMCIIYTYINYMLFYRDNDQNMAWSVYLFLYIVMRYYGICYFRYQTDEIKKQIRLRDFRNYDLLLFNMISVFFSIWFLCLYIYGTVEEYKNGRDENMFNAEISIDYTDKTFLIHFTIECFTRIYIYLQSASIMSIFHIMYRIHRHQADDFVKYIDETLRFIKHNEYSIADIEIKHIVHYHQKIIKQVRQANRGLGALLGFALLALTFRASISAFSIIATQEADSYNIMWVFISSIMSFMLIANIAFLNDKHNNIMPHIYRKRALNSNHVSYLSNYFETNKIIAYVLGLEITYEKMTKLIFILLNLGIGALMTWKDIWIDDSS